MKQCFACKQTKELDKFYKHKGMADGHLNRCIQCCCEYTNSRRRAMPEHFRAIDYKRNKTPERRRKAYESTVRRRAAHPDKDRARRLVNYAVRVGHLIRPEHCLRCPTKKVEAHHPDYSKPLDVIWLCHRCHRREHGTLVD